MDKNFTPSQAEKEIYSFWEQRGLFTAKLNSSKTPFSIILPPPNANANLHIGHAMFVFEDAMIRYHKMRGEEVLWLAGADHAGFETQYVFEKYLQKQGKSRYDYDRETLYKMIWDFVMENKHVMEDQLRRLGFALDWSREKFTIDPEIVKIVYKTFKKLHEDGLIYRADRLVNYCTKCGTSFSDLEVLDKDAEGFLYYITYPSKEGGNITVATTRPETLFGDVAVMVHPQDKRYKNNIGKTVILPLANREIPVIGDEYVDMKFGTGAVKVTPAHDFNDFEVGKRHGLYHPPVIGFNGKLYNTIEGIDGLRVKAAREETLKRLAEQGLLVKTVNHKLVQKTCYKCGGVLEPLPLEQWYIKVDPLKKPVIEAIKTQKIKVFPKRFEKRAIKITEDFIDWNISRQVVWGIRIPAWKCEDCVAQGKGEWIVTEGETPSRCPCCQGIKLVQDTDTFDTWFSSGQWPFATLMTEGEEFYRYFYPTTVMETGHDILRAWVVRMMMLGIYMTKQVPFTHIVLHGMVRDRHGQKMSKSKGNVVNPLELVDKYGADALRAALVFGLKEGNDVSISDEKVIGMRNFSNKIWNIGRFIQMYKGTEMKKSEVACDLVKDLLSEHKKEKAHYHRNMKNFKFSKALEGSHQFLWHRFADFYIEQLKEELKNGNIDVFEALKIVYLENVQMIHPFMPFVTEAIWQIFNGKNASILETTV
ncbi:valine--tRNA ligase [Candidatus Roizmanbacteria bacterium]|nr:valine--tRNA ligase [Candidatus Roizmanbacteria bacterium]